MLTGTVGRDAEARYTFQSRRARREDSDARGDSGELAYGKASISTREKGGF